MIAALLKERRLLLGLSQSEVATLARVSPRTVLRVEGGQSRHEPTIQKLCRALQIEPDLQEVERMNSIPDAAPTPPSVPETAPTFSEPSPKTITLIGPGERMHPQDQAALVWSLEQYVGDPIEFFVSPDVAAYRQHGRPSDVLIEGRTHWAAIRDELRSPGAQDRFFGIALAVVILLTVTGVWAIFATQPEAFFLSAGGVILTAVLLLGLSAQRASSRSLRREQRLHDTIASDLERTLYAFRRDRVYRATIHGDHVAVKIFYIPKKRRLPAIAYGATLSYEFYSEPDLLRALPDHPRIRHRMNYLPDPAGVNLVNTEGQFAKSA